MTEQRGVGGIQEAIIKGHELSAEVNGHNFYFTGIDLNEKTSGGYLDSALEHLTTDLRGNRGAQNGVVDESFDFFVVMDGDNRVMYVMPRVTESRNEEWKALQKEGVTGEVRARGGIELHTTTNLGERKREIVFDASSINDGVESVHGALVEEDFQWTS